MCKQSSAKPVNSFLYLEVLLSVILVQKSNALVKWISECLNVPCFDSHCDEILKYMNWIPFGLSWSGKCWDAFNTLQLQMGIQSIDPHYSFFLKLKKVWHGHHILSTTYFDFLTLLLVNKHCLCRCKFKDNPLQIQHLHISSFPYLCFMVLDVHHVVTLSKWIPIGLELCQDTVISPLNRSANCKCYI